jgi:hypothetical protein
MVSGFPPFRSEQHGRSECQGDLGVQPHDSKREKKEGRREREKEGREKKRKDLDEMDSTPDVGDAQGLTVEKLTSLKGCKSRIVKCRKHGTFIHHFVSHSIMIV